MLDPAVLEVHPPDSEGTGERTIYPRPVPPSGTGSHVPKHRSTDRSTLTFLSDQPNLYTRAINPTESGDLNTN